MLNTGNLIGNIIGHVRAHHDRRTGSSKAVLSGHPGQIPSLENLSIVVTGFDQPFLKAIPKLKGLKSPGIEVRARPNPGKNQSLVANG